MFFRVLLGIMSSVEEYRLGVRGSYSLSSTSSLPGAAY